LATANAPARPAAPLGSFCQSGGSVWVGRSMGSFGQNAGFVSARQPRETHLQEKAPADRWWPRAQFDV